MQEVVDGDDNDPCTDVDDEYFDQLNDTIDGNFDAEEGTQGFRLGIQERQNMHAYTMSL